MKRLLKAEIVKFATNRSAWGLVVGVLGVMVLGMVATVADVSVAQLEARPLHTYPGFQFGPTSLGLAVVILGILSVGDEFRYGTITPALLVSPRRAQFVVAKIVAMALIGLAFGIVGSAISLGAGLSLIAIKGAYVTIIWSEVAQVLGGVVVANGLGGALGAGIGALAKRRIPAVVGTFVWMFLVENLIRLRLPDAAKYLPAESANALSGQPLELAQWTAGILLAGYAVAAAVIGLRVMARRDI